MAKDAAFAKGLWDASPTRAQATAQAPPPHARRAAVSASRGTASIEDRYGHLVVRMRREHDVRVVKWRTRNTGCAWQVHYADGSTTRLIEAPYPRGPVSCAVFLHEIGHHAIGFYRYKPRCYEEYMAWRWSLSAMRANGFTVTRRVEQMVDAAMRYAVSKAIGRGIKRMPVELAPYLPSTHRLRELPLAAAHDS